ncbi:oligosaccharide flippase family protein [Tenuifilum osseticum]|uniref:oligosaccharide flippase family protein n=1 Tax=Tenuifilum osseticum TaxID=3374723 RepID=UPI0034E3B04B
MKFNIRLFKLDTNSIFKSFFSVFIFNLISAFLGFMLNIILARYFDVETYGNISYFIASFLVLYTIFEFGFGNTLVILKSKYENNLKNYVNDTINTHFLIFSLILLIFTELIIQLFGEQLKLQIYESRILITSSFIFALYNYLISIYQADGKWMRYNYFNLLSNFLKFFIFIIVIFLYSNIFDINFTFKLFTRTYLVYTLILFLVTLYFIYPHIHFKGIKLHFPLYKTLIPLGITNLIVILAMRVDNFIILHKLDNYQLGIYSAANSFALFFPIITGSLMKVLLRESANQGINYLKKIIDIQKKYFIHLIIFIIIIIFTSKYLIIFFFGSKYLYSIPIFQVLSIVYIGGVFFTPLESYFFSNHQTLIMLIRILQLLIIIIFGFLLIDLFGLIGMAIAIVLSRIIAWFYFTIKSKKVIFKLSIK